MALFQFPFFVDFLSQILDQVYWKTTIKISSNPTLETRENVLNSPEMHEKITKMNFVRISFVNCVLPKSVRLNFCKTRLCDCEHEMKLIFRIAEIDRYAVRKNAENKNN